MKKKYIVELEDNQMAYTTTIIDGVPFIKLLQTSPYTAPDLEQVRKESYDKGYMAAYAKSHMATRESYQQGLNDAWDAARKIVLDEEDGGLDAAAYCEIFGYGKSFHAILKAFTASEAIEKIRQYEQGKEVENGEFIHCPKCGHKSCASDVWDNCEGMFCPNCGTDLKRPKTQFDLTAAVLEKMREGQEQ